MTESCIFCRIVAGEIPAAVVASSESAIAFRDLHPQAPVHILVIPRRHTASLAESNSASELGAVLSLAAEVASSEGLNETGYRIVTNVGSDGGQTVPHLHFHLLGGRQMAWPPG